MDTDREAKKESETASPSRPSVLTLIASGEQQAMGALYDQYSGLVYSVALRILRDPRAAEDVLQEVLMQLWRAPQSVSSEPCLSIGLALAARNRAVSLLRRTPGGTAAEDIACASRISFAEESQRAATAKKARSILTQLPRELSKALSMAFFDGMPPGEIAAITGDPSNAVKHRIRTALLAVRKAASA